MEYIDLLAKIQVLFRSLAFLEPSEEWGWKHPALQQWMGHRGIASRSHLETKHLQIILRSLEKRHSAAQQRYRSKCCSHSNPEPALCSPMGRLEP